MVKRRLNIRMSGLGGQGAVTAAHVMAMAASRDGKFAISNPFFGAEKRMAPAESYCRIGINRIWDRGELVFPRCKTRPRLNLSIVSHLHLTKEERQS